VAEAVSTIASDAVGLAVQGWYGGRRARLVVTSTAVVVIHRKGREEIPDDTIERVRCSSGLLVDKVSFCSAEGSLVFRVGDIAPFASWVRRSRIAPRIDIDNDVMKSVREYEKDERMQVRFRTGVAAGGGLLTANLAERMIARLFDAFVVFVLAFLVALATASSDDAFIALIFAFLFVYEIPLVAFCGCTVGKLWFHIRVASVTTGRPPGLRRATIRTLLAWPAILLGRLRFMLPDRPVAWLDGVHDRAAGTVVLPTSALRVLREHPEADRPRLLADAQRRQIAGLSDEERELAR
jgi:hypothetical protein